MEDNLLLFVEYPVWIVAGEIFYFMHSSEIIFVLVSLIVLLVWVLFCIIPAKMAKSRGRSYWGWFLFSFLFNPLFGILILACLGDTEKRRREKVVESEEIRLSLKQRYSQEEYSSKE